MDEHILSLILVPIVIILLSIPIFWLIEDSGMLNKLREIAWKDKIKIFKPKSELEKEIADKKREIKQLKKHKADMEKLKELEHEHEGLFELTRTPSERHFLKGEKYCAICDEWYQGERCPRHVKNQYAVDPSKFMSGQSTKKTGEECNRAIPPHVKPYIHPSLTTHDNFSRQKNDDQQKALNILLEDMKHEKL